MPIISEDALQREAAKKSYRPFDIVMIKEGAVGVIQEVSLTQGTCRYAVEWLYQGNSRRDNLAHAWWEHDRLTVVGSLFTMIAKMACHPMGQSSSMVEYTLFGEKD